MKKQIYLSAVAVTLCVVGLLFIKLSVLSPWWLLISAFLMPTSIAISCLFVSDLKIYGPLAILIAVAHILILGSGPYSIVGAILWMSVVISLPPMVQKDLSTRVKLNIIEVTRRPVKWVLFLIAVSYAVLSFYRFSDSDVISKMAVAPKFEMQVIALSYPEITQSTDVNQFVNIVTGNEANGPVDEATRNAVLGKLGITDKLYTGNEKIFNENDLLYQFVGGRLQDALGRFEPIVPLLVSIFIWQGLVLLSYIILPLLLAIIFETFIILIKYKFAEVVSFGVQKEEIRL